jgi:hypothetical protein
MSVGNQFNHLKLSYFFSLEKTEKHQENEIM